MSDDRPPIRRGFDALTIAMAVIYPLPMLFFASSVSDGGAFMGVTMLIAVLYWGLVALTMTRKEKTLVDYGVIWLSYPTIVAFTFGVMHLMGW